MTLLSYACCRVTLCASRGTRCYPVFRAQKKRKTVQVYIIDTPMHTIKAHYISSFIDTGHRQPHSTNILLPVRPSPHSKKIPTTWSFSKYRRARLSFLNCSVAAGRVDAAHSTTGASPTGHHESTDNAHWVKMRASA